MNLKLCLTVNKTKRTKIEDKLVDLQSERLLFSRCAIVANSDRDLDMVSVIGKYELDVIPRSLMTADGSLHPGCDNKSELVECVTDAYSNVSCPPVAAPSTYRVAIIDAMVVVQKIVALNKKANPGKKIKSCLDFSIEFVRKIESMIQSFQEVRIVFDYYEEPYLKTSTRSKRGNVSDGSRFLIEDETNIDSLSNFLSNIPTKRDFMVNLAHKVRTFLNEKDVKHLVSAKYETLGNIPHDHMTNNHEEADTLMILHCISCSSSLKPESCSITGFSPDTDVACLLIAFKDKMVENVFMDTGFHVISIVAVFQSLGMNKAKALLSLHALSGCDTTGRFQGKGKQSW